MNKYNTRLIKYYILNDLLLLINPNISGRELVRRLNKIILKIILKFQKNYRSRAGKPGFVSKFTNITSGGRDEYEPGC